MWGVIHSSTQIHWCLIEYNYSLIAKMFNCYFTSLCMYIVKFKDILYYVLYYIIFTVLGIRIYIIPTLNFIKLGQFIIYPNKQ